MTYIDRGAFNVFKISGVFYVLKKYKIYKNKCSFYDGVFLQEIKSLYYLWLFDINYSNADKNISTSTSIY